MPFCITELFFIKVDYLFLTYFVLKIAMDKIKYFEKAKNALKIVLKNEFI